VFVKRGDAKKCDQSRLQSAVVDRGATQSGPSRIGTANVTEGGKPVATIALLAPANVAKSASLTKRLLSIF